MFFGLPDPDPTIIMHLDSYYFVTLFDFLSLKNDVNVPSKVISRNKKKLFLVDILKVYDKNSRIRSDPDPDPLVRGMDPQIRIHTKTSWIRNSGLIIVS